MKKKVKFMQTCCKGDGRPVQAPSNVLCAECLAGLSEKMNNLLKGGQHVNEPGVGPMARLKQENRDLKAENARLLETVKFQEKQYLAEHGHWGECKYKVENARLKTENENALAIINELRTGIREKNWDSFYKAAAREQAGSILIGLKAENAALKAKNARLKTENENARDRILYHSGGWEE